MNRKTDVIVIGGGQAGLAASRCLSDLGIDHVVFERGEIGQRWRSERWNSLRLLTPNWMSRLPGRTYTGNDPTGFMTKDDVAEMLSRYSAGFDAPVLTHTQVLKLRQFEQGFRAETTRGSWRAKSVVIATGACDTPRLPAFAQAVDPEIAQITLNHYTSPAQVAKGGVLVVGASASGCQIASELQAAGRNVTLAAGQHTRLPRQYRGRDIMEWLDKTGILTAQRNAADTVEKLVRHHSFQLVGSKIGRNLGLASFQAQGGRVVGRVMDMRGKTAMLAQSLPHHIAQSEARQVKILRQIDGYIAHHGLVGPAADRIDPVRCAKAPAEINLSDAGIQTIVWATGYRRDYSWLDVPVLTDGGEIQQDGGATPVPGLYTMGLPHMRRCNSSFIDGVGQDAHDITRLIATHLGQSLPQAA